MYRYDVWCCLVLTVPIYIGSLGEYDRHVGHLFNEVYIRRVGIRLDRFLFLFTNVVQTALFSTSFCTSAKNAFYLIARNLARVAAVTILGDFVLNVMTVR